MSSFLSTFLNKPCNTFPGPTSVTEDKPSVIICCIVCVQSTDAVSCFFKFSLIFSFAVPAYIYSYSLTSFFEIYLTAFSFLNFFLGVFFYNSLFPNFVGILCLLISFYFSLFGFVFLLFFSCFHFLFTLFLYF